jgi:hypothetical protein
MRGREKVERSGREREREGRATGALPLRHYDDARNPPAKKARAKLPPARKKGESAKRKSGLRKKS